MGCDHSSFEVDSEDSYEETESSHSSISDFHLSDFDQYIDYDEEDSGPVENSEDNKFMADLRHWATSCGVKRTHLTLLLHLLTPRLPFLPLDSHTHY